MTRVRPSFAATFAMGAVGALTTCAALASWNGFVADRSTFVQPLVLVAALVAVSGAVLRSVGTPAAVAVLVQVAATAALVSSQVTGSLLPGGALVDALGVAVDSARAYAAPISTDAPPVWPLMLVGAAVFLLVVDITAATFRRVPGAGLALLAVYSVPSGLLEGGPGWVSFVLAAGGFLVMLHLDARDQLTRWGRPLGPLGGSSWRDANPLQEAARAGAAPIGVTAVALALLLPAFVPVLDVDVFDIGAGSADGEIKIRKPIADMRRDLDRDEDVPLIRVATDDPNPSYLRVSVLNRFTGNEWSSGDRDVAKEDTASGRLPDPAGLSADVPRTEYDYDVAIDEAFDSTWLPTQFPAGAVDAEGDWRFDPATMDFLAADDDLDTEGLRYEMTGVVPHYGTDGRWFRDAASGSVGQEVLDLPSGIPDIVTELATSVTDGALNDYERALLLQRWFRQTGGFEYSLERAPRGTGNDTLASFLSEEGRVGYCEQYASAMAVMARVLGIPARVAVGFLDADPLGDGVWEYSSHDLHAWPELYFAGAGWVRFEPTPAGRARSVPDYSRVLPAAQPREPDNPRAGQTAAPTGPTQVPSASARQNAAERQEAAGDQQAGDSDGWSTTTWLAVAGVVLLLGLGGVLLLGPPAVRRRTRSTRLGGDPDAVWAELRATAVDLGLPWPDGRSPRAVGTVLADHLADPAATPVERPVTGADAAPEAAGALDRIVLQVERSRYARPGAVATLERTSLADDAGLVVAALEAGVPPRARQRAQWLPRSIWRRQ